MKGEEIVLGLGTAALVGLLGLTVYATVQDAKQFAAYREANHCKEAGYISGHTSTGYGMGANGQMAVVTTTTPRKTRWLCDNNVEIIR